MSFLAQKLSVAVAASAARTATRATVPALTRAASTNAAATGADYAATEEAAARFDANWSATRDSFHENLHDSGREIGSLAYQHLKEARTRHAEATDTQDVESNYSAPINATHFARKFNTPEFLINRYEIFKSNQREEMLETMHAAHEADQWLTYSKIFAPLVFGLCLIVLPIAILRHEHNEHPAYPYLNIRRKAFPWGEESPFNILARKLGMSHGHYGYEPEEH
eukprot:TRINITY_DN24057_c0_g1_i1.p2 TRINITY_DN24057_c0_g1~~TRINITY_DN24057_c0_g1_i1.p2  ORF type:complete len:224 (-),score=53.74 TRINITY_DN24057_c0_g1_i1:676-1347(-)